MRKVSWHYVSSRLWERRKGTHTLRMASEIQHTDIIIFHSFLLVTMSHVICYGHHQNHHTSYHHPQGEASTTTYLEQQQKRSTWSSISTLNHSLPFIIVVDVITHIVSLSI